MVLKDFYLNMATYYITISDDGNGLFTPSVQRGGTGPSGGTAVTVPTGENIGGTYSNKSYQLGVAIERAKNAAQNDRAANG